MPGLLPHRENGALKWPLHRLHTCGPHNHLVSAPVLAGWASPVSSAPLLSTHHLVHLLNAEQDRQGPCLPEARSLTWETDKLPSPGLLKKAKCNARPPAPHGKWGP